MSSVRDFTRTGTYPVQHHMLDWPIQYRQVTFAGRLTDIDEAGRKVFGIDTKGDVLGWNLWPRNPENNRPVSAWSPAAWGAVAVESDKATQTPGGGAGCSQLLYDPEYLPIANGAYQGDDRFAKKEIGRPMFPDGSAEMWPTFPYGVRGVVVSTTEEYAQTDLFLPTDPNLYAVHSGGDLDMGSRVFDVESDQKPNQYRWARLQSAFRVIPRPGPFTHTDFGVRGLGAFSAIGLNINRSGCKDTFGGFLVDIPYERDFPWGPSGIRGERIHGVMSHNFSGPFDPATGEDKHVYGEDADSFSLVPQHLSTNTFWIKNHGKLGPPPEFRTPTPGPGPGSLRVPRSMHRDGDSWTAIRDDFDAPLHFEDVYIVDGYDRPPQVPVRAAPYLTYGHIWYDVEKVHRFHAVEKDEPYLTDGMYRVYSETPLYKVPTCTESKERRDTPTAPGTDQPSRPDTPTGAGHSRYAGDVIGAAALGEGNPVEMTMMASTIPVGSTLTYQRPQRIGAEFADMRRNFNLSSEDVAAFDDTSPVTIGSHAFGAQGGGNIVTGGGTTGEGGDPYVLESNPGSPEGFDYNQLPCQEVFAGGTADGGVAHLPPELDITDFPPDFVTISTTGDTQRNASFHMAKDYSTSYDLHAPGVAVAWGIPDTGYGGVRYGWAALTSSIARSNVSIQQVGSSSIWAPNLNFYTYGIFGNSSLEFSISPTNGLGFYSGTGNLGRLSHSNTGFRTWTFPDITGRVLTTADADGLFTAGYMPFADANGQLAEDTIGGPYWDLANHRLYVGFNSGGAAPLNVRSDTGDALYLRHDEQANARYGLYDNLATAAVGNGLYEYWRVKASSGITNIGWMGFDIRDTTAYGKGRWRVGVYNGGLRTNYEIDENAGTHTWSLAGTDYLTLTSTAFTIEGDLDHDGSNIGFFGTAPAAQAAAYTPSNVSTDRSYDANSTTVDELADVLGTLIADLQSYGLLQ